MTKDILVIAGHGQGPDGFDPGAVGNGTNEAEFLREVFIPAMKKYAPSNMRFHTGRNVFAWRDAKTIKADEVIELHLDAGVSSAEDGHIIIYSKFNPDDIDKRSVEVIKDNVGIRYGGISKRNNLYNLNKFAERGISYRLAELAFITNKKEMDYMFKNVDKYAKELVEAIINGKTIVKEPVKVENVYKVAKGDTLWAIGRKFNVTVKNLKAWNNLKSDAINIDQKLILRGAEDLTPVTEKEPTNPPVAKPASKKYQFANKTLRLTSPIMHGADVLVLQQALASIYFYPEKGAENNGVDGYYGPKTADCVMRFQLVNGLKADGIFGPDTRKALDKKVNK